jgi:hypothetical protein
VKEVEVRERVREVKETRVRVREGVKVKVNKVKV